MARRKKRKKRKANKPGLLDRLFWGEKKRTRRTRAQIKKEEQWKFEIEEQVSREIWAVICLASSILIFLSLSNNLGLIGEWINILLKPIFGDGIYIIPVVLGITALALFTSQKIKVTMAKITGMGLFIISILSIAHLPIPENEMLEFAKEGSHGGYIGFITNFLFRTILKVGNLGSSIIFVTIFLISLLLTFEVSISEILQKTFAKKSSKKKKKTKKAKIVDNETNKNDEKLLKKLIKDREKQEIKIIKPEDDSETLKEKVEEKEETKKHQQLSLEEEAEEIVEVLEAEADEEANKTTLEKEIIEWEFPKLDLLDKQRGKIHAKDSFLLKNAEKIKSKLKQFDIDVSMSDVHVGPTVIQYTLKPHEGVKLSKITGLKNDIALALAAKSVRIEAPIPGKALVGIEVPTDDRTTVRLKEILESKDFKASSSDNKLTIPLGRNVSGKPILAHLNDMPHLLIAGATGAGKSVAVNSFLLSLLYQNSPTDLKLILIDPKHVELKDYNGIPHLLTEVITDPDKAANSLKWAVTEMTRRYNTLSIAGCRNIDEYNADEGREKKMPKIIILIDELADLMMANSKEVEAAICRIAQMARAVGIHLIIATQRPSVDVITGLIKANIPTRISFAVTSSIDSRTILDAAGAEDLLGKGDMLYLPKDLSKPIRIQGIFVSPQEIKKVTNKLKLTMEPDYKEEIIAKKSKSGVSGGNTDGHEEDELYGDAIDVISRNKKASASLLQRKLKIGYARAARLLDILEENGIVGPVNGAKPRELFLENIEGGD